MQTIQPVIINLNNAAKTKTLLTKAKYDHYGLSQNEDHKTNSKQEVSFPSLVNDKVKQPYCD